MQGWVIPANTAVNYSVGPDMSKGNVQGILKPQSRDTYRAKAREATSATIVSSYLSGVRIEGKAVRQAMHDLLILRALLEDL